MNYTTVASDSMRTIAWSFLVLVNPVACLLCVKNQLGPWEGLIVVSLMGVVSVVVSVLWSGLFYRPTSRLTDWLSLLLLYGAVSAVLQACLPARTDGIRKAQMLVPALMATVWGAAWGWKYVETLAADSFLRRLGLMAAGVLFVIGVPLAFWLMMLVITFGVVEPSVLSILLALWLAGVLAIIPGILLERRARRLLAESAREISDASGTEEEVK